MTEFLATREVYGETLAQLGEINKNIVVLDADLSSSTRTTIFAQKFPHRFFNMGISEQDMMGTAAGLAASGKIPFVSTFAIFASGRAWEQVRQTIAYPSLNVKIVTSHGGITVGEDGASHQCTEDLALMRVLPHMTVIVPADGIETRKAIEAVVEHPGPVYVRLSRIKFPVILKDSYQFKIGKGIILREGKDITIVATGLMVYHSLEAAKELEIEGISARVVNLSTIKPLDQDLLLSCARETKGIVTVEEHSIIGGLGSAVAEVISEKYPIPLKRVGIKDRFGTSGKAEMLLEYFNLTPKDIVLAVKEVINLRGVPKRKEIYRHVFSSS